jgi:5-oxopent-3-ene-1,2,5-tricarboxylate decarboxylase/2-hydroxyhepta-2,4-diene-1,7-dioate isomerase
MAKVLIRTRTLPAPVWLDREAADRLAGRPDSLAPPIVGSVFGVALNVRSQIEAMTEAFAAAPYKAPPRAPVLYIKPPNTYAAHGAEVLVPPGLSQLEVNATLAVVIDRDTCRVDRAQAMDHVLGYTVAIDVCEPHASLYRPAIRQRCRDGFLPIGPGVIQASAVPDPDDLDITVHINGQERSRFSTAELVRPVAQLIADVSAFMTLSAGDVLLVGLNPDGALAGPGDRVTARIDGVGRLDCVLAIQGAAA